MARTEQVEPVGSRPQSMGRHRAPRGSTDIGMLLATRRIERSRLQRVLTMFAAMGACSSR
jgi:hypothetical protein